MSYKKEVKNKSIGLKICRSATVPFMLKNHLQKQISDTIATGNCVHLVCSEGPEIAELSCIPGVTIKIIEIRRTISLLKDFCALWSLMHYFAHEQFEVVHSTTPKCGLLSMLAAWLVRVPVRVHTFTGQPWIELSGFKRLVVKFADRLTAAASTMSYTDSQSQRQFLIEQGVVNPSKIRTLGYGSIAGIDLLRFNPERYENSLALIRHELQIDENIPTIIFIGRVTKDKGVMELIDAFEQLNVAGLRSSLLLVGPFEPVRDPLPLETLASIERNVNIKCIGYSAEPEKYLAVSDLLCLPSYREGFGSVILEAAAMGIPAVGTNIVGLKDAILNGETGLLVPPKNVEALTVALALLLNDAGRLKQLGLNARKRVQLNFDAEFVNGLVISEYQTLLAAV